MIVDLSKVISYWRPTCDCSDKPRDVKEVVLSDVLYIGTPCCENCGEDFEYEQDALYNPEICKV